MIDVVLSIGPSSRSSVGGSPSIDVAVAEIIYSGDVGYPAASADFSWAVRKSRTSLSVL